MAEHSLDLAKTNTLRILVLGKYPPIQGGESAKLYWLARFLGSRGHEVVVVSNFNDVAPHYKLPLHAGSESEWLPANVVAISTERQALPAFIPRYDPQVEKLTSLGLKAASKRKPNVVVGWYLLPYAIAAYNISEILGIPLVIQHAGSDLARLLPDPQLNGFLVSVLRRASMVLTYPSTREILENIGCKKIRVHRPRISDEFTPCGPAMDLETLGVESKRILLFLGKASKGKGLNQLLEAFGRAKTDAHLVVAAGGQHLDQYREMVREERIRARVHFIDLLPPWKVPALIRSARAVVIPEFGFGVKAHRSRLPVETLLCGRVPLVSSEITSLYSPWTHLIEEVNVGDTGMFADSIARVMNRDEDVEQSRIIASEVRDQENFQEYGNDMLKLLSEATV